MYGEVKKGEDVLVHAGASGVGLAAIHLARLYGAYVPFNFCYLRDLQFMYRYPSGFAGTLLLQPHLRKRNWTSFSTFQTALLTA